MAFLWVKATATRVRHQEVAELPGERKGTVGIAAMLVEAVAVLATAGLTVALTT